MSTIANELIGMPAYYAPMYEPEPGASIIQHDFLKSLMERVKDKSHDLAIRRMDDAGTYAIELVVRNSINNRHDIATIGHCNSSMLANKYVGTLRNLIDEYAKQFD